MSILTRLVAWKVKVKSLSRVRLFDTPWTVAYQAPPTMGFSRQEYWSGLPFPSPGDLPNPGIEPGSPTLEADALTSEPPGKLISSILLYKCTMRIVPFFPQTCDLAIANYPRCYQRNYSKEDITNRINKILGIVIVSFFEDNGFFPLNV